MLLAAAVKVWDMKFGSDVKHISCKNYEEEFVRKNVERAIILDVREKEEYDVSKLPCHSNTRVINIPFTEWKSGNHKELLSAALLDDKETDLLTRLNEAPVVVYCSIGARSSYVISDIQEMLGRENVHTCVNLHGGLFQYANSALSGFESSKGNQVHPYNSTWGNLLNDNVKYTIPEEESKQMKT